MKLFLKIFIPCVLGIPGLPGTSQSTGKPPKGHGNGFGLPGEKQIQDSKIYTDLDKEAIFNRYATAKKVPFQWSRERKIKFVQEQIGINNNGELTGELIVELEEKLKKMPILQGDVPSLSPSSMIAFGGKPPPIWLPDPEFGRDRGAPGTEEINGPSEYNIGPPSMNPSPKAEISKKQKVINFINKFGYIEQSLDKAYPKEVKFSDKIKEIQEQYGLSQTGSLDDKLIEEISKPRCGKKDSPSGIRAPSGYKINDGRHKWDGGNKLITWSQAGYSNDLPPEIQVDAMRRAFQVWSNVADIKFEYKGNDDPGKITEYSIK